MVFLSVHAAHAQDPVDDLTAVGGFACPQSSDTCVGVTLKEFADNRRNYISPHFPYKGDAERAAQQTTCNNACTFLSKGVGYCCNDSRGRTELLTAGECYEGNPRGSKSQDDYIFFQQKRLVIPGDYEREGFVFKGEVTNYVAACTLYHCCHSKGYVPATNDRASCPVDSVPTPVFKDGVKRDFDTACKDVRRGGFGVCCIPESPDPRPIKDAEGNPQYSRDGFGIMYGMDSETCFDQNRRGVGTSTSYFRAGNSVGLGPDSVFAHGKTWTIPKAPLHVEPSGIITEEEAKRVCEYNYVVKAPDLEYSNKGVCCNYNDYALSEGHKSREECDEGGRNANNKTIAPPWQFVSYSYVNFREGGKTFLQGDKNGDRAITTDPLAIVPQMNESYNYCKDFDSFICCHYMGVMRSRPRTRADCLYSPANTVVPIGKIGSQPSTPPKESAARASWNANQVKLGKPILTDEEWAVKWQEILAFNAADAGKNIGLEETKVACLQYGKPDIPKRTAQVVVGNESENGICCFRQIVGTGLDPLKGLPTKDAAECSYTAEINISPSDPFFFGQSGIAAEDAAGLDFNLSTALSTNGNNNFCNLREPRPARARVRGNRNNRGLCCFLQVGGDANYPKDSAVDNADACTYLGKINVTPRPPIFIDDSEVEVLRSNLSPQASVRPYVDPVCWDVFNFGLLRVSSVKIRGNGDIPGLCCYMEVDDTFTGAHTDNSAACRDLARKNVALKTPIFFGGAGPSPESSSEICADAYTSTPAPSSAPRVGNAGGGGRQGGTFGVQGGTFGGDGGGGIGGGGGAGIGGDDEGGGFFGGFGDAGGMFGGGGFGGAGPVGGGGSGIGASGGPGFGGPGFFGGFGFPGTIGGPAPTGGGPGGSEESEGSAASAGSEASVEAGSGEASASAGSGETGEAGDTGAGEAGAVGGAGATGVTGAAGGRGGELNGSGEESSVPDEGESEGGENREEPPAPSGIGGVIGGSGDAGAVGGSGEPRVIPAPGPRPAPAPRSASAASASASSAGGGMGAQLTGFVGGGGAAVGAVGVALFAGAGIGLLQWRNHSRVVTRKKATVKRRTTKRRK